MYSSTVGFPLTDDLYLICQAQFQMFGGVIRDNEIVTDITPGPVVTVSTPGGVYKAKSVVITAGPWANRLLAHTGLQLPLEVFKLSVSHIQLCPYCLSRWLSQTDDDPNLHLIIHLQCRHIPH